MLFFGIAWAIGFYYLAAPDEFSDEYLRPAMQKFYQRNITEVAKLSVVVYVSFGILDTLDGTLKLSA